MKKKQFKTESKKILDLMINSVYTNRDIFLRELISNASDAIDKLYYKSLTDDKVKLDKDEFCIKLDLNKEDRVITITDNGIGMTAEDIDKYITRSEELVAACRDYLRGAREKLND